MSQATRAKTAKERAQIAARIIRSGRTPTRAFDDCFEMYDGDEVKRILAEEMLPRSPKLRANIGRYLSLEVPPTMPEEKKIIVAKLSDEPNFAGDIARKVLTKFTIKGSYSWSGLGYVAAGEKGRKEYMGPLVEGPWAYGFGLCHVLDNNGGTGAEQERLRRDGLLHEVSGGELVDIAGTLYRVRIQRSGREAWVHLDNVT